ncbi:MAG: hypothetical protein ACOCQW_01185 [Halanaerobiaceae bacterium]
MKKKNKKKLNLDSNTFDNYSKEEEKEKIIYHDSEDDDLQKKALEFAENELELLYEAVANFKKEISGLKISDYIRSDFIQLALKCEFYDELLKGKFEIDFLDGETDYEKFKELRNQVFAELLDFYEEDIPL